MKLSHHSIMLTKSISIAALGGLFLTYLSFITIKQLIRRRKYRHIPGPPTRGYKFEVINEYPFH